MEEAALKFAEHAHGDQQRKYTKELYIEHPKRVAETVRTVTHNKEMICAAYLHDVVEDTPVSLEDIRQKFGPKIANLVGELTDEYVKKNYPDLNRRRRKDREVKRQAMMSPEAKTIKLADVIDNTMDIAMNDKGFAKKYIPEMEVLTNALEGGDPGLLKRARQEVERAKMSLMKPSRPH